MNLGVLAGIMIFLNRSEKKFMKLENGLKTQLKLKKELSPVKDVNQKEFFLTKNKLAAVMNLVLPLTNA